MDEQVREFRDEQVREFRNMAATCLAAARTTADPNELAKLIDLARHWIEQAESMLQRARPSRAR
jgi:hypothetical protein